MAGRDPWGHKLAPTSYRLCDLTTLLNVSGPQAPSLCCGVVVALIVAWSQCVCPSQMEGIIMSSLTVPESYGLHWLECKGRENRACVLHSVMVVSGNRQGQHLALSPGPGTERRCCHTCYHHHTDVPRMALGRQMGVPFPLDLRNIYCASAG